MSKLIAQADSSIFGEIKPPAGVEKYDQLAGGGEAIGLLVFVSYLVRLATIVAGLWVFFNFILAGYEYITAQGDTGAHNKVKDRITMSIIGLVIIAVAYTVMAILGLLLTGEAGFFLDPQIQGPSTGGGPTTGTGAGTNQLPNLTR